MVITTLPQLVSNLKKKLVMDYKTASMMRTFFSHIFNMDGNSCYHVAIVQEYPNTCPHDFSVLFYGGVRYSSFLSELTVLAHAFEEIVHSFRVSFCEYDAGTKKQDLRIAVRIDSLVRCESETSPESSI